MSYYCKAEDFRKMALEIGVHLSDETLSTIEGLSENWYVHGEKIHYCSGPEGWRVWLKNRISEMGLLKARGKNRKEVGAYVIMHVFPIHRKHVVLEREEEFSLEPRVSRSDIVRGHLIPRPIDKTAWLCAQSAPPKESSELVHAS